MMDGLVALGWRLDLISKVISNLNYSMALWKCCCVTSNEQFICSSHHVNTDKSWFIFHSCKGGYSRHSKRERRINAVSSCNSK